MSAGGMGGQVQQPMGGGGKGGMGMNRGPGGNAQNNPGGQGGPRPFGPGFFQQQQSFGGGGAYPPGMMPGQGPSQMPAQQGPGRPMNWGGNPAGVPSWASTSGMTPIQGLSNYGQPQSFPGFSGGAAGPTPRQQKPMPMGGLLSQLYGNFGG